jgi:hypothetical protein
LGSLARARKRARARARRSVRSRWARSRGIGLPGLPAGHPVQRQPSQYIAARQAAVQVPLRNRVHLQPPQASRALRYSLRKDPPRLRGGRCSRLRAALAARLSYSSQLCANLISIDTMRTSMPLAARCPASSKSLSRWQTSSSAGHPPRQLLEAAPIARAAARGARVPGTRHKPRPISQKYADGDLRTIGHGHGHGHVYGETSNSGTLPRHWRGPNIT